MKKKNKQTLIYFRYIFPLIAMLLMFLSTLIPSYRFIVGGEVNEAISGLSLMKNSYDKARETLFGVAESTAADILFSKTVLIYVLAGAVLCLVALVAAIYSAIVAVQYFCDDDERRAERSRTLFITFFPNRIVLSAVEMLPAVLLVFPYIMKPLYRTAYSMNVSLVLVAPDGLIIGAVLLVGIAVLSAVCAPMERGFGADVFKKSRIIGADSKADDGGYVSQFKGYEDMHSKEISEQNQRIRELLSKKQDNSTKGTDND